MSLSKLQTARYWRTWASVCKYHGWKSSDEARRRALHAEAECPASMRDFGNKDFDRFLDYTAVLLDQVPAPRDRERDSFIFTVTKTAKKAGLNEAYIRKISVERFDVSEWRDLPAENRKHFIWTIANRSSSKSKTVKEPQPF